MQKSRYSPISTVSLRSATILVAVALSVCLLVMPAMANPPSKVAITSDSTTSQIAVTITHPSDDPKTHYIKRVVVEVNGRVVIENEYQSQPTKDVFTYSYPVPLNAGDTVRATAYCSIGGSTEGVLTLPTPTSTAPPTLPPATVAPVPTTQKSPAGIIPVLGAGFLAALALARNRK